MESGTEVLKRGGRRLHLDTDFQGKKVLVVGAGVSGFAAAKILKRLGAKVTLSDAKSEGAIGEDFSKLRALGIELVFGAQEEALLDGCSLLLLSPAVPIAIPLASAAKRRGIRITSEVELAASLARSPIFAVTGTNGKTTTTTLLGLLLAERFGKEKTRVGGNIGYPLSEAVLEAGEGGAVAAEISSYQMEATEHFRPKAAAVLNVTPDHIKRHGSMEVYQAMKERLFGEMAAGDWLVLNYDDERTRSMKERAACPVFFFSCKEALEEGAVLLEGRLVLRRGGEEIALVTQDELGIKGAHNVENALAAAAMAHLAGVEPEAIRRVLRAFKGVEHRIEHFLDIEGVAWYNDSKATNTDSAIKALESFENGIVLIAGGDDKMTDLTDFMRLVKERCTELILVGDAAVRFADAARAAGFPGEHIHDAAYSMKTAVYIARRLAKPPAVVLLSPACASFDMFDGFEERGEVFKRLAGELA